MSFPGSLKLHKFKNFNPHVEFSLLLGNVPVSVNEGSQSFPPSAPPATAPYPASIDRFHREV